MAKKTGKSSYIGPVFDKAMPVKTMPTKMQKDANTSSSNKPKDSNDSKNTKKD